MDLKELRLRILGDSSGAEAALGRVVAGSKKAGEQFTKVGKSLTMGLTLPIVALGVGAIKLASDFNESLNKVEVAFKDSAGGVEAWAKTTLKSFGIAQGTALDMVSTYGDMATSMGLPNAAAASMSEKLVGLAGDLASFKNIGIEQANTALTAIFTGETESLKKLGIVMTQVNLQEFAAHEGIKTKIADMTQAEQVQLRFNYVLANTNNAQGDFIRTGAGTANQMRVFSETMKELGETLGQYLLPLITPVIAKLSAWAQSFGELSEKTQKTIMVIAGVVAAVGPLLLVIGGIFKAVGPLITIIKSVGVALTFLAANPVVLIIAGIVALTAGIVWLSKNWGKLWDDMKNSSNPIIQGMVSIIEGITAAITRVIDGIRNAINWFAKLNSNAGVNQGGVYAPAPGGAWTPPAAAPRATGAHASGGWVGLNGPEVTLVGEKGPEYITPAGQTSSNDRAILSRLDDLITAVTRVAPGVASAVNGMGRA